MALATTETVTLLGGLADELAGAPRTTMLRNLTLNARDWTEPQPRWSVRGRHWGVAVEFRIPSDLLSPVASSR